MLSIKFDCNFLVWVFQYSNVFCNNLISLSFETFGDGSWAVNYSNTLIQTGELLPSNESFEQFIDINDNQYVMK
jgi:hypothetical protein